MNTKLQFVLLSHFLLRFVAPFAVLLGVFFAKKATSKTTHYGQDSNIQRYVLPDWLSWFNSPDDELIAAYNKYRSELSWLIDE